MIYHFSHWFRKPKAEISFRLFSDNYVHATVSGRAGDVVALFMDMFERDEIAPLIAEAQAELIKKKFGIDPRDIAKKTVMEHMMHHEHGHEHDVKPSKKKTIN